MFHRLYITNPLYYYVSLFLAQLQKVVTVILLITASVVSPMLVIIVKLVNF